MKSLLNFFIYFLWAVSFTAMSESHLEKTPRLKALFDDFEFNVVKIITWQAHANIKEEILLLMRYFERCSIFLVAALVAFSLLHVSSAVNFLLAPIAISVTAWMSFRWTFKHRDALRPLVPWVYYALSFPFLLFVLDSFADTTTLFDLYNKMPFRPVPLETDLEAMSIFTGFIVIALILYYIAGWFVLSPFAYVVLGLLKLSRLMSLALIKSMNREIWNYLIYFIALITTFYSFFFAG